MEKSLQICAAHIMKITERITQEVARSLHDIAQIL